MTKAMDDLAKGFAAANGLFWRILYILLPDELKVSP